MKSAVLTAAIALLMASSQATAEERSEIAAAKEIAARKLKDPSSAQFRDLRIAGTGDKARVCGEINGKNSYGGYVGFMKFSVAGNAAIIEPHDNDFGLRDLTLQTISAICTDTVPVAEVAKP